MAPKQPGKLTISKDEFMKLKLNSMDIEQNKAIILQKLQEKGE